MIRKLTVACAAILLFACSKYNQVRGPYASTNEIHKNKASWYAKQLATYPLADSMSNSASFVGTTNFSMRAPNFVIIHHTAQDSVAQTLKTFTRPETQVSAHFVIGDDGTTYQMLNEYFRAHHAGLSKWGNNTDVNSCSIGIELDNNGKENFSDAQIESLLILLGKLKMKFKIPTANFIGHADVAPGRKNDPSKHFPWEKLAGQGFGYWYDTVNLTIPKNFDPITGLRIIGYNTLKPDDAIEAYKIHFRQDNLSKTLTESDIKIIYSLMLKYQ